MMRFRLTSGILTRLTPLCAFAVLLLTFFGSDLASFLFPDPLRIFLGWFFIALLCLFPIRHFVFLDDRVELFSSPRLPSLLGQESLCLFRRTVPKRDLKAVTLHSGRWLGLVVVTLRHCELRHEAHLWQFLLHNRRNVLCLISSRKQAAASRDAIYDYLRSVPKMSF